MQKLLYIEDEVDFRESVADFLRNEGYEVYEAANGEEGYTAILDTSPDLVISDIRMPGKTGLEMLSELRSQHPDHALSPFLFLTALSQKEDIIAGRQLGVDDYLIKPIDFDVLLATVKSRLAQSERIQHKISNHLHDMTVRVLHSMTKELREPLNAILGYGDLIRSEAYGPLGDPKYKRYAENLMRSSGDLRATIDNAIDTTHLINNLVDPVMGNVDLERVLWESTYTLKLYHTGDEIPIINTVEPSLPMIRGDVGFLTRVAHGLISDMSRHLPLEKSLHVYGFQRDNGSVVAAFSMDPLEINNYKAEGAAFRPYCPLFSLGLEQEQFPLLNRRIVSFLFAKEVMKAHRADLGIQTNETDGLQVFLIFPTESLIAEDQETAEAY